MKLWPLAFSHVKEDYFWIIFPPAEETKENKHVVLGHGC